VPAFVAVFVVGEWWRWCWSSSSTSASVLVAGTAARAARRPGGSLSRVPAFARRAVLQLVLVGEGVLVWSLPPRGSC
jgi:hypothetical protein